MTSAGRPTPERKDSQAKVDLWLESGTGQLFVMGLTVVTFSFVTAGLILFVYLWFAPSGSGVADIFNNLWFGSFIFWALIMYLHHNNERKQKLVEEKVKNEAAIVERLKQELKARDEALLEKKRLEAEAILERKRLEAIESERQQGIYVQNRMNERMRETGLPRMAADATDFEVLAAQWTYVWGDREVEVTSQTHDEGIDVQSWNCLGQVKFYSNKKVGAPEVQQLRGATSVDNSKVAIFFAFSTGYTNEAINFADRTGVALFQFNVETLAFISTNAQAETVLNQLHSLL
jgi:hypothetical protein